MDPWIPSVFSQLISLRFISLFSIVVSILSCSIIGWKNKQTTIFIYYLIIEVFTLVSIVPYGSTSNSPRYYYLWKICTWVCIILIATRSSFLIQLNFKKEKEKRKVIINNVLQTRPNAIAISEVQNICNFRLKLNHSTNIITIFL